MFEAPAKPPYRVIQIGEDEAYLYAGMDTLALFAGGGSEARGHKNADFCALAVNSHEALVAAVQATLKLLPIMSLSQQTQHALREKLETALRASNQKPETTTEAELERRYSEIDAELATPFDGRESSHNPTLTEHEGLLLEEQEEIEFLLGKGEWA